MNKQFQDTQCYQTRLSEIRKHPLDFYDFKKIFGFSTLGFDIYADDIKSPDKSTVIMQYQPTREDWEKFIDDIIEKSGGDIRICWHKSIKPCNVWDEYLHTGDNMYKKARIAFESLDEYEFPNHDQFFELPVNTAYFYVSSRYCNGLVFYLDDIHAYMIDRYTMESGTQEKRDEFNKAIKDMNDVSSVEWFHTDLGKYCPDNVIVTGVTDSSWVMIWYDQDVSDCNIYRFSKDRFDSREEFDICVKIYLENMCSEHYSAYRIRDPKGGINF